MFPLVDRDSAGSVRFILVWKKVISDSDSWKSMLIKLTENEKKIDNWIIWANILHVNVFVMVRQVRYD